MASELSFVLVVNDGVVNDDEISSCYISTGLGESLLDYQPSTRRPSVMLSKFDRTQYKFRRSTGS